MSKMNEAKLYKMLGYSERSIGRMLNIPKSTVHDNVESTEVNPTVINLDVSDPRIAAICKKVVFLDIETTLIEAYAFSQGITKLTYNSIKHKSETKLLTVAYASLYDLLTKGSAGVQLVNSTFEDGKVNDRNLVLAMWLVMDKFDVMVAHNSSFDYGKLMGRFVLQGLPYPSKISQVDTMAMVRKSSMLFKKLDYLSTMLFGARKDETDLQLWIDCQNGCPKALKRMGKYNIQDVFGTLFPLYMVAASYNPDKCIDFTDYTADHPTCRVDGSKLEDAGVWTNHSTGLVYDLYENTDLLIYYRNRYQTKSKKANQFRIRHHI